MCKCNTPFHTLNSILETGNCTCISCKEQKIKWTLGLHKALTKQRFENIMEYFAVAYWLWVARALPLPLMMPLPLALGWQDENCILGGSLSNYDDNHNDDFKKNKRFNDQNNSSAHAARFLVHFFEVHCTTSTWNLPMRRFMEDLILILIRGSQSGQEKRWDKSFQVLAKEPLSTDSHQAISKNLSGRRLRLAQKMLCIIVPNRQTVSPEFFSWVHTQRLLSRSRLVWLMHHRSACSQETFSLI